MRISDWSSDVCSSDLPARALQSGHDRVEYSQWRQRRTEYGSWLCRRPDGQRTTQCSTPDVQHWRAVHSLHRRRRLGIDIPWRLLSPVEKLCQNLQHHLRPADRKSVVEGKSVTVRVELGGGRIIIKKYQEYHRRDTNTKTIKHNKT